MLFKFSWQAARELFVNAAAAAALAKHSSSPLYA
jgi:hypothetical protein